MVFDPFSDKELKNTVQLWLSDPQETPILFGNISGWVSVILLK